MFFRIPFGGLFFTLALGLGLLCSCPANAQTDPDSLIKAKRDTALIRMQRLEREKKIMESINTYSKRKGPIAKVVDALFDFNKKAGENDNLPLADNRYAEHDYKVVRNLKFFRYEPFGYSTDDTTSIPDNWLEKTGNKFHFITRRGRIRNMLLFRQGDPLEPFAVSESERLLRQTAYLLDAKIFALNTASSDSVDLLVYTKDIWSIGAGASYTPTTSRGRTAIKDVNFLGLGHRLEFAYDFGRPEPQKYGVQGLYRIENISNSYITAELLHYDFYNFHRSGINLRRDFYTPTTKYAGGLLIDRYDRVSPTSDAAVNAHIKFSTQDAWFGRSVKLKTYDFSNGSQGRLIFGGRIVNTGYTYRPQELKTEFPDSKLWMASIGYSFRKYYRDRYLFGFGRTEDIAAGKLFALTAGWDNGEFKNRIYSGAKFSWGKYRKEWGYLFALGEAGSYYDGKKWEQGVLNGQLLYFTKLYRANRWLFRQFIWNRATYGFVRRPTEYLTITSATGLRGFNSDLVRGTKRYSLNLESNVYTPFYFLGFRLAGVVFADFVWLSRPEERWLSNTPYQGYGIGIRLKNEYLIFNTIQLLLAYYPLVPGPDDSSFKFLNSQKTYFEFNDFVFTQPFVAPF
jgi:hypothetical protein